jgi:hypothetical protein
MMFSRAGRLRSNLPASQDKDSFKRMLFAAVNIK